MGSKSLSERKNWQISASRSKKEGERLLGLAFSDAVNVLNNDGFKVKVFDTKICSYDENNRWADRCDVGIFSFIKDDINVIIIPEAKNQKDEGNASQERVCKYFDPEMIGYIEKYFDVYYYLPYILCMTGKMADPNAKIYKKWKSKVKNANNIFRRLDKTSRKYEDIWYWGNSDKELSDIIVNSVIKIFNYRKD